MMSKIVLKRRKRGRERQVTSFGSASLPDVAATLKQLQRVLPGLSIAWLACVPLTVLLVGGWGLAASAQDEALTPEYVKGVLDAIWITVASVLVIFMNAGFGMLETGFCRQKNAVNILSKNLIVFALATIAFWAIGFSLMFGSGNGFIGGGGWFLTGASETYGLDPFPSGLPVPVFFLFQVAFAATAATIVSGCCRAY